MSALTGPNETRNRGASFWNGEIRDSNGEIIKKTDEALLHIDELKRRGNLVLEKRGRAARGATLGKITGINRENFLPTHSSSAEIGNLKSSKMEKVELILIPTKESKEESQWIEKAKKYCDFLQTAKHLHELIKVVLEREISNVKEDTLSCIKSMLKVAKKATSETDTPNKKSIKNILVTLTLLQSMRKKPLFHTITSTDTLEKADIKNKIEKAYLKTINLYIQEYSKKFLEGFYKLRNEALEHPVDIKDPLKIVTDAEELLIQSIKDDIKDVFSSFKTPSQSDSLLAEMFIQITDIALAQHDDFATASSILTSLDGEMIKNKPTLLTKYIKLQEQLLPKDADLGGFNSIAKHNIPTFNAFFKRFSTLQQQKEKASEIINELNNRLIEKKLPPSELDAFYTLQETSRVSMIKDKIKGYEEQQKTCNKDQEALCKQINAISKHKLKSPSVKEKEVNLSLSNYGKL